MSNGNNGGGFAAGKWWRGLLSLAAVLVAAPLLWDFFSPSLLPQVPLSAELMRLAGIAETEKPPSLSEVADTLPTQSATQSASQSRLIEGDAEHAEQPVTGDVPLSGQIVRPGWSLRVGERQRDLPIARQLIADLRARGFHPYIRRHHLADGLHFAVYIGPWLTQERLQQAAARLRQLRQADGLKYWSTEVVQYFPPSVLAESAGN